jgi:2-methylcitrate dehydratase PrpD
MELTREFANRISSITSADLSPQAVHNAKIAILDTVGVTLAGSREEAPALLLRVPGMQEAGPSLVFGHGVRTSALNAALVNGTSAHAMDFDDVNIALGGHPSAPVVPALMALAETTGASGLELLTAFVAGFETETRLGRGVNFHHYEKGWHPTATLGIFGVAAASARLLNLPAEQIATALAIAASLASGIKSNFGSMTKPLHVGHCARNGLFAAFMAQVNFTAKADALEHKQGFLNVFNGPGNFDVARMFADWASPLDIERPGTGIKLYPCCGSTHASIDAAIGLAERSPIDPADVEHIGLRIHARRVPHIDRADPKSDLDAKFSVQYCVARALLERRVVVDHFENNAFDDPTVRQLMRNTHVQPYTNPPPDVGDHYAVELTVTLRSGRKLALRRERPCGRTPDDPTPPERLKAKFESCAARALDDVRASWLYAALQDLEHVTCVRDVLRAMNGGS